MSKPLDQIIMQRAIDLVEAGWCQYTYARTSQGKFVDWRSSEAVAFCAVGAILRAMDEVLGPNEAQKFVRFSQLIAPLNESSQNLMYVNDTTDKAQTLAAMRQCLSVLRGSGSDSPSPEDRLPKH